MSRIGKQPIEIPSNVSVAINERRADIKGPKGEITINIPPKVIIDQKDGFLLVSVPSAQDSRQAAFWGLARSLLSNGVEGVVKGFEKKLEINGIGYKAQLKGDIIILNLGFSHPIEFNLPKGIYGAIEGNVITISGIDKQLVGETAAKIRKLRKPEPYKGKGIKYSDEVIRRKVGKVVKGSE